MSFDFEISEELEKALGKLAKKDSILALAVRKKIAQLISSDTSFIEHLKNLKGYMSDSKRVHIGSFVLIFKIKGETLFFERLEHHDEAYER